MAHKKVKYVIIGAGSAGLSARREIAKVSDDYLLFDGGKLGTTCARVGCMPSKVLIQVADDHARMKSLMGLSSRPLSQELQSWKLDDQDIMKHVRQLRDRFVRAVLSDMESWTKEHLIREYIRFTSPHSLIALDSGDTYEFEKAVIASGTRPWVLPALSHAHFKDLVLTTDEIFEQDHLPQSLLVIGLGFTGLELGQAFSRLGVKVTGLQRRPVLAGIQNPQLATYALEYFHKQFEELIVGEVEKVELTQSMKLQVSFSNGQVKSFDKVLMTAGRVPDSEFLGLRKFLKSVDDKGIPLYDPYTFQLTDFSHLAIAGDVTGEYQILHEASDEGKIAGLHLARPEFNKRFKKRTYLGVTFCEPNIGRAGLGFADLKDHEIAIGKVSFEGQGRSIVKRKEVGELYIYADKKEGLLLGAEGMGPNMEHLLCELAWLIQRETTVDQALELPFYHPVVEEGMRTALRDLKTQLKLDDHRLLEIPYARI